MGRHKLLHKKSGDAVRKKYFSGNKKEPAEEGPVKEKQKRTRKPREEVAEAPPVPKKQDDWIPTPKMSLEEKEMAWKELLKGRHTEADFPSRRSRYTITNEGKVFVFPEFYTFESATNKDRGKVVSTGFVVFHTQGGETSVRCEPGREHTFRARPQEDVAAIRDWLGVDIWDEALKKMMGVAISNKR